MARFPRVVVVGVPHHVTQRGNARQVILASDADRLTYLALLRQYAQLYGLSLLGYCLMSNHVHLIAAPHTESALGQSLKQAHGRYAQYWTENWGQTGRFCILQTPPIQNPHPLRDLRHCTRNQNNRS